MQAPSSFGLYIHWPFCESKCPYCDFNSHVRKSIEEGRWEKALLKELETVGGQTKGRTLTSVFFGGGTPSLMPAQTVQKLIDALGNYWTLDPALEITLEGNPNSMERAKYKDFKAAGVNRVSIGIQSLQQDALTFLGRLHTAGDARKALEMAASLFDRTSFDLIYALPGQSLQDWETELKEALTLARGHLSLYQLTIEPGTAFHTRHQRGDFVLPDENLAADLYELTRTLVGKEGYQDYEVSNYAKEGHECRHNLLYWTYGDYACLGPGAHGRLKEGAEAHAYKNYKLPETWLQAVETTGHGQEIKEPLTPQDQVLEHLLMGLRLKDGISKEAFHRRHGSALMDLLNPAKVTLLKDLGFAQETPTHFTVTQQGMLRLNGIICDLATTLK